MLLNSRTLRVRIDPAPDSDEETEPLVEAVDEAFDAAQGALQSLLEEMSARRGVRLWLEVRP